MNEEFLKFQNGNLLKETYLTIKKYSKSREMNYNMETLINFEENLFKNYKFLDVLSAIFHINKKLFSAISFCGDYFNFYTACKNGSLTQVKEYVENKTLVIERKDGDEKTPLHYACFHNHLPIVEYLISEGANIEAKSSLQKTPLHYACEKGHLPVVEYLLTKSANIEAKDWKENTPLQFCQTDVVKYLLSKGYSKKTISKILFNLDK